MMKSLVFTGALVASLAAVPAFAANVLSEKNLSLELADQLAAAAIQSCSAQNYNVAVTVVDNAGVIRTVKRMDNAGPHTIDGSRMKAFTALTTRNATSAVMKNAQQNAGAANLKDIPGFLLLGGGLPVKVGQQTIGAIGVAGAPGGHLDEQCAQQALDAVQKQINAG